MRTQVLTQLSKYLNKLNYLIYSTPSAIVVFIFNFESDECKTSQTLNSLMNFQQPIP